MRRLLEAREPIAAIGEHGFRLERLAFLHRHDRTAHLAPALVGHTDDGNLGNGLDLVEQALDLRGIDVLSAGDVHVLEAIFDVVETFRIAGTDVARP